jgi:aquaporin Z
MSDTEPVIIPLSQKVAAEVLGTFALVFFGAGTAVVSGGDYVATALAFGLVILVMVYAVGHISGGHFNPAVSVGAALSGRIAWSQVAFYVGAQLAGALLGGLALFTLLQGIEGFEASDGMGQNFFGDEGSSEYAVWAAFLLELLATAVFVYVILAATDLRNPNPAAAPAVIGLALTFIHFATIGLTGTSVNPARSIGVGVFAGSDAVVQLWLFILAPLAGAAVAGLTYHLVFGRDRDPVEGSGLNFSRPAPAAGYAGAWDPNAQYQQQGWDPSAQQQWGQTGQQQQWETQYPGWRWDAAAQQWVPDQQQQWQPPEAPGAEGGEGGEGGEDPRTQIRPPDGPA